MTVFSAHQMGTARMGADPKKSCVDPQGECWEVRFIHMQGSKGTMPVACILMMCRPPAPLMQPFAWCQNCSHECGKSLHISEIAIRAQPMTAQDMAQLPEACCKC